MSSWNPVLVVAVVVGCGATGVYLRLATQAPRGRGVGTICLGTALLLLLIGGVRHAPVAESGRFEAAFQLATCLLLGTGSLVAATLCVTGRRIGQAVVAFQVLLVCNAGLIAAAYAPFLAAFAVLVLVGGLGVLLMWVGCRRGKSFGRNESERPNEPLLACLASSILVVAVVGSAYEATTNEAAGRRNGAHPALPTRGTIEAVLDHLPREAWFAPSNSQPGTWESVLYQDHSPALMIAAVLVFVAVVGASLTVRRAQRTEGERLSNSTTADVQE